MLFELSKRYNRSHVESRVYAYISIVEVFKLNKL